MKTVVSSLFEKFNTQYNKELLEKWDKNISEVKKVYPNYSKFDSVMLATILENTSEHLAKADRAGLLEATQDSAVGPFVRQAFPIITALMPNLVAGEVVSIQALKQKIGQIFFLSYVYGSTKGNVAKGTVAMGPYETNSQPDYTSEHVPQEIFGASGETSYSGTLQWGPVRPHTLTVTAGAVSGTDNGEGVISGTGVSGTIDYASGAVSLTFTQATTDDVECTYDYNLEYAPAEVADFDIKVEEKVVIAKTRKLRTRIAFDAVYDLNKQFGYDANSDFLKASVTEIKHEIDQEILGDLLRQAGLSNSWNETKPNGISLIQHYESFIKKLTEMGNQIYYATKRATGNVVICGINAATVCESLPGFVASDATDKVGAYVAGTIKGTWKVIKNPFYGEDDFLVAYKGDNFLEAGYVYAPYLPVFASEIIMLDDFVQRRGFATSYAKKMLCPNFYVKGKITHNPDALPVTTTLSGTANVKVTNTAEDPVNTKEVQ